MEFEKKNSKCPVCGDKAEITTWKPPRGIDQRFREYRCTSQTCRTVFYMPAFYHTSKVKP
ncbi:unnamed protein product [marine sediment metagenome]|uniref:Zinc finger Ogr/Delta-type domain-containing protein n=2 Tax=marine sediment metagenome TaxID=412755 RepID=X1NA37_9ZZZZ